MQFLVEAKVFSFSVTRKNSKTAFALFSEPVPIRGIIGIDLQHRKSRISKKSHLNMDFGPLLTPAGPDG